MNRQTRLPAESQSPRCQCHFHRVLVKQLVLPRPQFPMNVNGRANDFAGNVIRFHAGLHSSLSVSSQTLC